MVLRRLSAGAHRHDADVDADHGGTRRQRGDAAIRSADAVLHREHDRQSATALRARARVQQQLGEDRGLLPALTGTDPVGTNYGKTRTFPNWSLSGNVDWVASPKLFFGVRGGYYSADQHDSNVTEEPRYIFEHARTSACPGVPATCSASPGSRASRRTFKVTRDQQTRVYFQADGTVYASAGGEHQIKFGAQVDSVGNNVLSGEDTQPA